MEVMAGRIDRAARDGLASFLHSWRYRRRSASKGSKLFIVQGLAEILKILWFHLSHKRVQGGIKENVSLWPVPGNFLKLLDAELVHDFA